MTGIAAINLVYAKRLTRWMITLSAVINEIIESFDDSFLLNSTTLNYTTASARWHNKCATFLKGSKLVRNRKELFSDHAELVEQNSRIKFRVLFYSLLPQIIVAQFMTLAWLLLLLLKMN